MKFIYKNTLKWQGEKKGLLSSPDKPDIEVATPPEFRGHPGIWTPEDLFVASINSCIMTTFLYYAQKESLEILNYESQAEGILERIENQFIFTEIKLKLSVSVKKDSDVLKAKNLLELSEKKCLISKSIKSKIKIIPEIKTAA
ncbi:MAG: OsmC family protein [Candidatus Edwardsbacteria bacterium]